MNTSKEDDATTSHLMGLFAPQLAPAPAPASQKQSQSSSVASKPSTSLEDAAGDDHDDDSSRNKRRPPASGPSSEKTPLLAPAVASSSSSSVNSKHVASSSLSSLFDAPPSAPSSATRLINTTEGLPPPPPGMMTSFGSFDFNSSITPKQVVGKKKVKVVTANGGAANGTIPPIAPLCTRRNETDNNSSINNENSAKNIISGNVNNKKLQQQKHSRGASNLPSITEVPVNFHSDSNSKYDQFHSYTNDNPWYTRFGCNAITSSCICQRRPIDLKTIRTKSIDIGKSCIHELMNSSTWVGSFMALLFHSVFCLTIGSAITRQHSTISMIGLMTKTAAMGIICSPVTFWVGLSDDMPALYPTVDLFTAPFLANVASMVDTTIYNDRDNIKEEDMDLVFLATFGALASTALLVSGTLLVLSTRFKLANLGSFLPSAVLSGFFAAVGVLTWTLAIKVDTNGVTVGQIVRSGDWNVYRHALIHHAPSVFVGLLMKLLGPKHPFYVIALIFATAASFYLTMFFFGISMEEMIEKEWFWGKEDLMYTGQGNTIGISTWSPPAPFGWIVIAFRGKIHWGAYFASIDTVMALGFLYMIRCSLHGAALKKNVPNLQRRVPLQSEEKIQNGATTSPQRNFPVPKPKVMKAHHRIFSEAVDIEQVTNSIHKNATASTTAATSASSAGTMIEQAQPTKHTLTEIIFLYGVSQWVCACIGSFAITPSVAASNTMYTLRAEKMAPQIGAVLMLTIFYLTDFQLISYIPKPAFSSLLVLACIDLIYIWLIKTYWRFKEKIEWLVVPSIVILANVVGLLSAVFLGVALSTFFFVAAFYRAGVVKFLATGVTIRSTIERPLNTARWLDQNGELIQILVLQNYLFFGNASSIQNYVSSMFEEPNDSVDEILLPPIPKVIVMDMTLVSGIDSSAVDVISDIFSCCKGHNCKLFLSGLSQDIRQTMALGGIKPETDADRSSRKLRLFPDIDTAIGKAEDLLIKEVFTDDTGFRMSGDSGFLNALRSIDKQHETEFSETLHDLEKYTCLIELEAGEVMYEDGPYVERGISFIEEGVLKIERSSDATLSRVGSGTTLNRISSNAGSLNQLKARSGTIGRQLAQMKASIADSSSRTFRVARIGPGWVLGSMEALTGMANPGSTIAVTPCRMYHIPFKILEDIEEKQPVLILRLYKLMSLIMSKRQEVTINHLATLHSIMGAPAHKRAIGRTQLQSTRANLLEQPM